MVSSPDIDHGIEIAFHELVIMIGNIRGKVGWRTVTAHHNVVLVFAQCGRDKPCGVFLVGDVTAGLEERHCLFILTVIVKTLLAEPYIKGNSQQFQVSLNLVRHLLQAELSEL